jgi:lipoic acid synthetase
MEHTEIPTGKPHSNPRHTPIHRFVTPDEFKYCERIAKAKGFLMVAASPLTRSGYHAGDDFKKMQENRKGLLV